MKKRMGFVLIASVSIFFAACGTAENDQEHLTLQSNKKAVSEREIIAELEQTATETPIRDAAAKKQLESDDFKSGFYGEPSVELEEDMAVQSIEALAVSDAIETVYGSHGAFRKEGVLFIENQSQGAEQSGVWIGIKEPDDRLDELQKILQAKVDAGEILAKPIYFYRSDYAEMDLELLQEDVLNALKPMQSGRGSFGISTDTKTGNIEIAHDFLKEEQQADLRKQFAGYTIHFEQQGRLVAEPGEPTTTYPDRPFTETPSKEGTYVMQVDNEKMLVVDTMPKNFNSNGSGEDFYDAVFFTYPNAAEELKVGQRVKVEVTGFILHSYPGQGSAKYVEVLPEYKPKNAKLSESEVIEKVIEITKKKSDGWMIIRSIAFDEEKAVWKVEVKQGEQDDEMEIRDE
ncbi:YobA family protein [Sporosarcina sp. ACRSM]|uniref:DUF3221 domain-containing protein n=1 Tax=Sporosarcina sp. ACRSM TaxID=2918216 RepID=UPI001EF70A46|nr:DUF3221 domain-containing protein [Sporosarcina sp. ACRSM]MCG7337626.1 YobA family protein [Sporosarcina sp. ACRSM]